MSKLWITRGYPGSGKTTWANDVVTRHGGIVVCRDDIRKSSFGLVGKGVLDTGQEEEVSVLQTNLVASALRSGMNVVVADTNLNIRYINKWCNLAIELGVEFEVKDFKVDAEECIRRNDGRLSEERVSADVIRKMAKRSPISKWKPVHMPSFEIPEITPYVPNEMRGDAVIFDMDGTLADCTGIRNPYDAARALEDKPVKNVITILDDLQEAGNDIIILTGRTAEHQEITEQWLAKYAITYDAIYTRADGDQRPDWIVKQELFDEHIAPHYNVIGVFDDRLQVCKMWHKKGLTLFRVNDPCSDF